MITAFEAHIVQHARRLQARGQTRGAEALCRAALRREPNLPYIHVELARLRLPGPEYAAWLSWLHAELRPQLYLEIGVETGASLALAQPPTRAIGVDPAPVGDPLARCRAPTQLYVQTSADFLAAPPPESGLSERGFDLAFIDGDHSFSSVLADFCALEAYAAPGAVIVLHDTLPLTAEIATPVRQTGFYTGDAWKILPCLRALRPELRLLTLPAAPSGLTLVVGLDPSSRRLQERRDVILEAYRDLLPTAAIEDPARLLALGSNDPAALAQWLSARPIGPS